MSEFSNHHFFILVYFQRPSALAKIVGVYRIGFRNQQTNNAMKQDLLVVENLFYNRNISQVGGTIDELSNGKEDLDLNCIMGKSVQVKCEQQRCRSACAFVQSICIFAICCPDSMRLIFAISKIGESC